MARTSRRRAPAPGRTCALAAVLLAGALPAARAQLPTDVRWGAQLRYTSDYLYRGYSKSADRPTVQVNVSADGEAGWFAGVWASAVDFGEARFEFNPYAGWLFRLGPDWQLEAAVAGFLYDARTYGEGNGYADLGARLRFRDLASVRVGVAPDAYGAGEAIPTFEMDARYPLTDVLEVSVLAGHSLSQTALDYDHTWYGVGFTRYLGRHVALELRYQGARESNDTAPSYGGSGNFYGGHDAYVHARAAETADASMYTDRIVLSLSIGF